MHARTFFQLVFASILSMMALTSAIAEEDHYGIPVVAVDWPSLHRSGAQLNVWVTKSFAEPITLGHDTYPHQSQTLQYAIKCVDHTYALKQWKLTDAAQGQGDIVWADRATRLDFVEPAQGSWEAAIIHAACESNPTAAAAADTPDQNKRLQ